MSKEDRNLQIIKMYNLGSTERLIADTVGLSKAGVHKIITAHLEVNVSGEVVKIEPKQTVTAGVVFDSFVSWTRTDVNQYANKDTGEVVNVKFIPASGGGYGHFITV